MASEGSAQEMSTYETWVHGQGIPILKEFSIPSLKEVAVGAWGRLDAYGAYILMDGAEDSNDSYILEIPAGKTVQPEKHLYEEIVYVLSGQGSTAVWQPDGPKRTFEWHEGSLFALPLNAWHQFFNGQGSAPARLYVVSTAPLVMNLFHNLDFIFNVDYRFLDRFDSRTDYFSSDGKERPRRGWETNFVADVRTFPLIQWKERGAGGVNRNFELGGNILNAHVSEFPVGTYKKAHHHGPGAHVIIIQGQGYSLVWQEGRESERVRVDWKEGSVLVPPNRWFHQHFNTGNVPGKYLALRWGSLKYSVLKLWAAAGKTDTSTKQGGSQIDYEDEEPYIRRLFEQELAKNGVPCQMPPIK